MQWNTGRSGGESDPAWDTAEAAWKQEQRAEDARLLYVGLTRAEHALWIATGAFPQHERTALAPMLRDLDALQAAAGAGAVALCPAAGPSLLQPLRRGYGEATAIVEALQEAMLTALVGNTLTVALPEGTCLAAVPEEQRRNEMEFHFAMRPTRVDALLALLHRFGVAGELGARQRLEANWSTRVSGLGQDHQRAAEHLCRGGSRS
ncbi:hypothetical protein NB693_25500 [Pantoea ananatis]|uniref:hypothetical protein n=1 Tax=Pantoea ananas TaxID=553 RepID=UPI002220FE94|nr:hypothetical protein [Pantoea ananatis]